MITLYMLGRLPATAAGSVRKRVLCWIDAGFSAREVERRAEAVGLDLSRVAGIALTHEHGDHSRGALGLTQRSTRRCSPARVPGPGLPCCTRKRSIDHWVCAAGWNRGRFVLEACSTSHDAADPLAIVIRTADGASAGFAYDLGRPTLAVRYLLRN